MNYEIERDKRKGSHTAIFAYQDMGSAIMDPL